jgi:hypothetical protein
VKSPVTGLVTVRRLLAAIVATTLALTLAGCGDQEKTYCAALKADQEKFAALQDDTTGVGLLDQLPMLRRLADKAPDDLDDEWQTFLGALDAFADTLRSAGLKPDDFVDGKPPVGLSAEVRAKIAAGANELASTDVVAAANGIEQQAKDVCKLQLGL